MLRALFNGVSNAELRTTITFGSDQASPPDGGESYDVPGVDQAHATVALRNNKIFAYDHGSMFGTFVNSKRLMPLRVVELRNGDVLELCQGRGLIWTVEFTPSPVASVKQNARRRRPTLRPEHLFQADALTCPVCLDIFVDPVNLDCGHVFCSPCATLSIVMGPESRCPQCREPTDDPHPVRPLAELCEYYVSRHEDAQSARFYQIRNLFVRAGRRAGSM